MHLKLEYTEVSAGGQEHGLGIQTALDLELTMSFHFLQLRNSLLSHHDEDEVQGEVEVRAFSH